MNKSKMYRQGDVLIRKVESLPDNLNPVEPINGRVVLALGESTGHMHSVDSALATMHRVTIDETARTFLNVALANCFVTHDEHASIALEPGLYEVIQQREYSYWNDEVRFVAD